MNKPIRPGRLLAVVEDAEEASPPRPGQTSQVDQPGQPQPASQPSARQSAGKPQPAGPRQPGRRVTALQVLTLVVMLGLAGLLVSSGMDLWRRLGAGERAAAAAPGQAVAALQAALEGVTVERDRLLAELAARKQSETQIKALELENSTLSGNINLLDSLIAAEKTGPGLAIRGLRAEMLAPGKLHYVLLLAHGATRAQQAFDGQLQLAVTVFKDQGSSVIVFPDNAAAARYGIKVQRYQRLDGVLDLPPGATAKTVTVRLLAKGQVLAQQLTTVKDSLDVRP